LEGQKDVLINTIYSSEMIDVNRNIKKSRLVVNYRNAMEETDRVDQQPENHTQRKEGKNITRYLCLIEFVLWTSSILCSKMRWQETSWEYKLSVIVKTVEDCCPNVTSSETG
jgi:hypothetical protein